MTDAPTRIRIAHSPDSDDAFMFYALTQDKLDTGGLAIDHELRDIETLNQAAFAGNSRSPRCRSTPTPTCRQVRPAAFGRQHGRRLRPDGGRARAAATARTCAGMRVAVPGKLTTAVPGAAALAAGDVEPVIDAVRPDPRRRRRGRGGRRRGHPRGAAHLPGPGPARGRRSRRLVAGARPAARCRWAATSSAATSTRAAAAAVPAADREHPVRPGPPRRRRSTTPCTTPATSGRPGALRPLRRHVRQRLDARLRRRAAARRCSGCSTAATRRASCRSAVESREFVDA